MTSFRVIAAVDQQLGLGKEGDLVWNLPGDMAYFKRVTSTPPSPSQTNVVIMGRKTWESIPPRFRPLKERLNIVITRQRDYDVGPNAVCVHDFDAALEAAERAENLGHIYVVGGGTIYDLSLQDPRCAIVYLTEIEASFSCDTYFPKLPARFVQTERSKRQEDNGIGYYYVTYSAAK